MKANIYFNWLDDSRMLAVLPSQEVAEKVVFEASENATGPMNDIKKKWK